MCQVGIGIWVHCSLSSAHQRPELRKGSKAFEHVGYLTLAEGKCLSDFFISLVSGIVLK